MQILLVNNIVIIDRDFRWWSSSSLFFGLVVFAASRKFAESRQQSTHIKRPCKEVKTSPERIILIETCLYIFTAYFWYLKPKTPISRQYARPGTT
ncbi:hypothetical protein F4678DRAFT_434784 [Xylaria arbuscula]|nr:hypothetical protein F4678DRAFT_434784 [Xylaria arbuscula]